MAETATSQTQVSIRKFAPNDRERLIELIRELQTYESEIEPRVKPPEELGDEYVDRLLSEIAKHGGAMLIAENAGEVCGYAAYMAQIPNDDEDEIDYTYAYVADVAVTADLRGKGVGRKLLEVCERGSREAGAEVLRISVLSQNAPAIGLYRNFGFSDRVTELEKPLKT